MRNPTTLEVLAAINAMVSQPVGGHHAEQWSS
jgi:hypothetical protein